MKRSYPIFLYHHVSPDRDITPDGFERQMRHLLDQGYQSMMLGEIVAITEGRTPAGQPGFAVTFDDGYLDNWIYAFPILKKLRLKATMFLVTDRVEATPPRQATSAPDTKTREREPGGFVAWSEVKEMIASGLVEIGSHTMTHRHFRRQETYDDLRRELNESKSIIEAKTGAPCRHLAWPWGDYERAWLPVVRELGFQSAVTTRGGANTTGSDPLELRRIKISRRGVDYLASRCRWNQQAMTASAYGFFQGWDRRFKTWLGSESPYSHG